MRYVKIAEHYRVKAVEKLEGYRQQIQLLVQAFGYEPSSFGMNVSNSCSDHHSPV